MASEWITNAEVRERMVAFLLDCKPESQGWKIMEFAIRMFDQGIEPTPAELAMIGVERGYRLVNPVVPGHAMTKVPVFQSAPPAPEGEANG